MHAAAQPARRRTAPTRTPTRRAIAPPVRPPPVGCAAGWPGATWSRSVLLVALVAGASGWSSSPRSLAVQRRPGRRATPLLGAAQIRRRRPTCPTGAPLARARPRRDPRPGRGAGRRYAASTSRASWPDGVLIEVTERTAVAVVEIGGRLRGHGRRGRAVPRLPATARRPAAWSDRPADTGSDALAEAARVVAGRCPPDLAGRVDHVEVRTVDKISLRAAQRRARCGGGAPTSPPLKAQVLAVLLAQPGRTYDVSVPGQPVTSRR